MPDNLQSRRAARRRQIVFDAFRGRGGRRLPFELVDDISTRVHDPKLRVNTGMGRTWSSLGNYTDRYPLDSYPLEENIADEAFTLMRNSIRTRYTTPDQQPNYRNYFELIEDQILRDPNYRSRYEQMQRERANQYSNVIHTRVIPFTESLYTREPQLDAFYGLSDHHDYHGPARNDPGGGFTWG